MNRQISEKLVELSQTFPILIITGPRQAGKTTLAKSLFADYDYVSLENPDTRLQALFDPIGFLNSHAKKCIIDEIQYVPELIPFIHAVTNREKINGNFILVSSQNLSLKGKILHPLDNMATVVKVLPLSQSELNSERAATPVDVEDAICRGSFPAIHYNQINPDNFYPSYTESYIQHDIRYIQNIKNLTLFMQFLKYCAGRTGQILDYSALARDTGISVNSAKKWISMLETGFVIFLLQPYHNSFGKRMIKSPKLYFYDTGLLSYLLSIGDKSLLKTHPMKSVIFENFILLELLKYRYNKGLSANIFYWRDNRKNEISCIVDGNPPNVIELMPENTFKKDSLKQVKLWNWLTGYDSNTFHVVYGGEHSFKFLTTIYSWKDLPKLCSLLPSSE